MAGWGDGAGAGRFVFFVLYLRECRSLSVAALLVVLPCYDTRYENNEAA